ncbi:MAG: hypothetical protein ABJA76_06755 [Mucilaginibacter sp.]
MISGRLKDARHLSQDTACHSAHSRHKITTQTGKLGTTGQHWVGG